MSPELQEQISQLKKNEWVDLQGLISCATTYLASSLELPGLSCDSISFLGRGYFNTVYKLEFSDNSRLAASVSNLDEEDFDPEAKRSEVKTMKFVRESGLYPDVPVPEIFAFEANFTNLACAPYVLMELVPGKVLAEDLNELPRAQQFSYIKSIARLQASLSKPVPFDQVGSIKGGDGQHVVGPLMALSQERLGGPYKSMKDLWRAQLEKQFLHVLQEWCNLEKNVFKSFGDPECTPQMFTELFHLLSSLIPHFQPPRSYLPLVLYHPDIAFQNILFDESSISSGDLKITGLLDWGGAQILPLMFTARYPGDLLTNTRYPFEKPAFGQSEWDYDEHWLNIPYDWTCTGHPSRWPEVFTAGHKLLDFGPSLRGVITKFYLRAYFSACYAEQLRALHGDADLVHATLFRDATYYMKFHEVLCSGWQDWVRQRAWIRETYWRLRMAGHGVKESEELIIGPNMYLESAEEEPIRDLGIFGEYPVARYYESSTEPPYGPVPKAYHK